jgi:hypothetical protein
MGRWGWLSMLGVIHEEVGGLRYAGLRRLWR